MQLAFWVPHNCASSGHLRSFPYLFHWLCFAEGQCGWQSSKAAGCLFTVHRTPEAASFGLLRAVASCVIFCREAKSMKGTDRCGQMIFQAPGFKERTSKAMFHHQRYDDLPAPEPWLHGSCGNKRRDWMVSSARVFPVCTNRPANPEDPLR